MANTKEIPVGVKIISVLNYIGAGLAAIAGLLLIFGGSAIGSMMAFFGALGGAMFVVAGILMLGLAVLAFFVARGLWHGEKWARIVSIIFACLGFLMGLFGLFSKGGVGQDLFNLILNGVIGGYLWFAEEVKTAFA